MVALRDMTDDEFKSYRLIFIDEYATDLTISRNYLIEEAKKRASEAIDVVFSQGINQPQSKLFSIISSNEENTVLGYLWVEISKKSAWISDFWVKPEWRGRSIGRAALAEMEVVLARLGVNEIGLRVAPNNPSAKSLYEKCGFQLTGFNMHRAL